MGWYGGVPPSPSTLFGGVDPSLYWKKCSGAMQKVLLASPKVFWRLGKSVLDAVESVLSIGGFYYYYKEKCYYY